MRNAMSSYTITCQVPRNNEPYRQNCTQHLGDLTFRRTFCTTFEDGSREWCLTISFQSYDGTLEQRGLVDAFVDDTVLGITNEGTKKIWGVNKRSGDSSTNIGEFTPFFKWVFKSHQMFAVCIFLGLERWKFQMTILGLLFQMDWQKTSRQIFHHILSIAARPLRKLGVYLSALRNFSHYMADS